MARSMRIKQGLAQSKQCEASDIELEHAPSASLTTGNGSYYPPTLTTECATCGALLLTELRYTPSQ
jgi:hypothetical protein